MSRNPVDAEVRVGVVVYLVGATRLETDATEEELGTIKEVLKDADGVVWFPNRAKTHGALVPVRSILYIEWEQPS